jgi:hypothetical protein
MKWPLHTFKSEIHEGILVLEMPAFSFHLMPPGCHARKNKNIKFFTRLLCWVIMPLKWGIPEITTHPCPSFQALL